jgi:hypothetical protein
MTMPMNYMRTVRRPKPPDAVPQPPAKVMTSPRRLDGPKAKTPKPPPPPPPEPFTFYCGHKMAVGHRCRECHETRRDRQKALALKRQKRQAMKFIDEGGRWRFPTGTVVGPLSWDGEQWSGSVYIPAEGGGEPQAFHAVHTSAEMLLREFKRLFLESLTPAAAGMNMGEAQG